MIYTAFVYVLVDACIRRMFDGIQASTVCIAHCDLPAFDDVREALRRYLIKQGNAAMSDTPSCITQLAIGAHNELVYWKKWKLDCEAFDHIHNIVSNIIHDSFATLSNMH